MKIEIKKIGLVEEEKKFQAITTDGDWYTLKFNKRVEKTRYKVTATIAKLQKKNESHKDKDERKVNGSVLKQHLNTIIKDEYDYSTKIYQPWMANKNKRLIGESTRIFHLWKYDRTHKEFSIVKESETRRNFAIAFFQTNGNKAISDACYWLGDYKKTIIKFASLLEEKSSKISTQEKSVFTELSNINKPHFHLKPTAYINYSFPLQKNFTGRAEERKMLNEWFDNNGESMFALIAIGGMGKSSLAWYWMQKDIIKKNKINDGLIWWSFYEKDYGFETFVNNTLKYACGEDVKKFDSLREKMDHLHQILREYKFLVVLDGAERLLHHYARLDAAFHKDKIPSSDDDQSFRSCAYPLVDLFLQNLADKSIKSKTLLTSRLFPLELEELEGCKKMELNDFNIDDSHNFFSLQGLDWTYAEVEQVCSPYGFLPLSLRLLTGVILNDPLEPNEYHPDPQKIILRLTHELKPSKQQILELAYKSLPVDTQQFLSKISAFRSFVNIDGISFITGIKDKEIIRENLLSLINRDLLLFDKSKKRYDLHPVVRLYCYEKLASKKEVHKKLQDFFTSLPKPEKKNSLEDINSYIELYYHMIRAGDKFNATQFLFDNLIPDPLYSLFGGFQLCLELLQDFFPEGDTKLPAIEDEHKQCLLLNAISACYNKTGKPILSVEYQKKQIELREKQKNTDRGKKNLATGLRNLAISQLELGYFEDAKKNLLKSIEVSPEHKALGHREMGRVLAYLGDWQGAYKELKSAYEIFKKQDTLQPQGIIWAYRSLNARLQGDFSSSLIAAKEALDIAKKTKKYARDLVRAKWELGAAYRGLFGVNRDNDAYLKKAEEHTLEALASCRVITNIEVEADILLEFANIQYFQGNLEETNKTIQKALKIANRCEYRLQQADIHLFLAQIAKESEDKITAIKEVEISIERASCGYKPTLDKAKKLKSVLSNLVSRN